MTPLQWTLPVEVLQLIFEHLTMPGDLLNCCLVCSTWSDVGLKCLWRAPALSRMVITKEPDTRLLHFKAPQQSVNSLVKRVEAPNYSTKMLDQLLPWVLQLTNLRVLKFSPGYLTCSRISHFPFRNLRVLEHLSIEQTDLGLVFLYQLLDKCPLLEDLSIQVQKGAHPGISSRSRHAYMPEARQLHRLRIMEEFRLKPCGELREDFLEMVLSATPSVQDFTLTAYGIPNKLAARLNRMCPGITRLRIQNLHVYGNSTLDRRIMDTSEEIAFHFGARLVELEMDLRRSDFTSLMLTLPNSWYERSWTHLRCLKLSGVQIGHQQMVALASGLPRTMQSIEISLPCFETTLTQSIRGKLNLDSWQALFTHCGSSLKTLFVNSSNLPNGFGNVVGKYCNNLKHLALDSATIDEYCVYDIVRSLGNSLSTLHIHSGSLGPRTLHVVAKKCTGLVELSLNKVSKVSNENPAYSNGDQARLYVEPITTTRFLRTLTKLSLVNWGLGQEFFDMLGRMDVSDLVQIHISEPCLPEVDPSSIDTLKTKFPEFAIVD
ncbi:hypothetical protein K493DRAFT_336940 [Basidiobolus meristosporus CBS 931.73]|uniref:F-box domain-containing protein n=1 Tax=Basidiobolus meristosporus CBS 931.73 TaxID=1314790 RepID=A0A1Y1YEJ8_9FUNG|nr:hypothetical protein K493DRAFT_336940 [Basidiobolus meristosporus CBS 931.73]|eukprot:ORX96375.1 hypothetical protein K493DRAFT_336940 [Basidiobolus meristosporus CBS 931.73]